MKIICMKDQLMKGINIVLKAVPVRTTLTIQECILLDASFNRITLTANDMELGIETTIEGVIEEHGKIALDAKLFSEIIRKLPEGEIIIHSDQMLSTQISCENANFNIMGKDGDDFSRVADLGREDGIEISSFSLKEMIRQTIFSVAQNDPNAVMTGELLEVNENIIRLISLDGHRISVRRLVMKESYTPRSVIIPGKTLQEISKILSGNAEEPVYIYVAQNQIMFLFEQTIVVSRLIEGKFYRIDQMIPKDYGTKITINRRQMLDCIDRSILLVREDDRKPLIFSIEENKVSFRITSQIGSMNEEIEIEGEGNPVVIGFNPKLLMDALRVIDDETIDIFFINGKSPCFIRDGQESYTYLILPVTFIE